LLSFAPMRCLRICGNCEARAPGIMCSNVCFPIGVRVPLLMASLNEHRSQQDLLVQEIRVSQEAYMKQHSELQQALQSVSTSIASPVGRLSLSSDLAVAHCMKGRPLSSTDLGKLQTRRDALKEVVISLCCFSFDRLEGACTQECSAARGHRAAAFPCIAASCAEFSRGGHGRSLLLGLCRPLSKSVFGNDGRQHGVPRHCCRDDH
jgi:hypothetical protein